MNTFPALKTGAIIQMPSSRAIQFSTDVVKFVDGGEQRFRSFAQPYHRWVVRFAVLDEAELQNIRAFVQQMDGAAGLFSFTDPWDGTVYAKCSLEGDATVDSLRGPMQNGTTLIIRENKA
jgi:phage-related protein